jgi:hypothetical protein
VEQTGDHSAGRTHTEDRRSSGRFECIDVEVDIGALRVIALNVGIRPRINLNEHTRRRPRFNCNAPSQRQALGHNNDSRT